MRASLTIVAVIVALWADLSPAATPAKVWLNNAHIQLGQDKQYSSHSILIRELVRHHVGGRLKVAPEHSDPDVLELMKKPPIEDFQAFARRFARESAAAGKRQFLIPYFIAGHPGSDLAAMIDLAVFLKQNNYRVEQVQDFIPGPFDVATCMYHTGIDPMTGSKVYVPRSARERRLQRALLQYWKPENYRDVCEALEGAHREDLIGNTPNHLIPPHPPKRAAKRPTRGNRAKRTTKGASSTAIGYRPHRKSARQRKGRQ